MDAALSQSGGAARPGVVLSSLPVCVAAWAGQAVTWLRRAREAISLSLGAVPAASGENALTFLPKQQ